MVVFGGLKGLEAAIESDDKLQVSDPQDLFQFYLNTCPRQGSRTIRTEVRLSTGHCCKKRLVKLAIHVCILPINIYNYHIKNCTWYYMYYLYFRKLS